MNIKDMEELCASIEDKDTLIVMELGEGHLITVCKLQSEIIQVPAVESEEDLFDELGNEIELDELPQKNILLLLPCTCEHEFEEGEINSQPELN